MVWSAFLGAFAAVLLVAFLSAGVAVAWFAIKGPVER